MEDLNTIYNPDCPLITTIPGGFQVGRSVVIRGLVLSTTRDTRFEVDLSCGLLVDGPKLDNICLHFNPRFNEHKVVLNSLVENKWGAEERYDNPFQMGQAFEVRIMAMKDHFSIGANRKHFADYKYRIGVDNIKTLYIKGCLKLDVVQFEGAQSFAGQGYIRHPTANNGPVFKPPVPYVTPLPNWGPGRQVFITGTPTGNSKSFTINFKKGADVLFHINARFNEKAIVRNCRRADKWEAEEREIPNFPFMPSAVFDMIVLCDVGGYKVAINGYHFFHFNHRAPAQHVDSLEISGDLTLQQVHLV